MKVIKCLSKIMHKDLRCANEFINLAYRYKETEKSVADTFYQLANDRVMEVEKLHKLVVNVINSVDASSIPEVMKPLWEFEHDMMIEEESEIKAMISSYK